jgi:hypothetical protein
MVVFMCLLHEHEHENEHENRHRNGNGHEHGPRPWTWDTRYFLLARILSENQMSEILSRVFIYEFDLLFKFFTVF